MNVKEKMSKQEILKVIQELKENYNKAMTECNERISTLSLVINDLDALKYAVENLSTQVPSKEGKA